MIDIIKKNSCTGCKMCADLCPQNAIRFEINKQGFWYPIVNYNKCVKCGLCKKRCPELNLVETDSTNQPVVYAGWSIDEEIRYKSTSGGVYYELARKFIEEGGYIAGCVYSDDYKSALHIVGNSEKELEKIMGSKYFQSDTAGIYRNIEKILKEGKKVLFCGTPCHIAAIISYFGKRPEGFYLLDFICKGINSPLAYRAYIQEIEDKFQSKILQVRLKSKKTGWESLATNIQFDNGKEYHKDRYTDWWIRGYTCGNLFMRETCQNCKYKKIPHLADITFGDFWGVKNCGQKDKEKGISVIFQNTDIGKRLLDGVADRMHLEIRSMEEVLDGNPYLLGQATQHKNRKLFFEILNEMPFSKAVKKTYVETMTQKIKRWIKLVLKRVFKRKKW